MASSSSQVGKGGGIDPEIQKAKGQEAGQSAVILSRNLSASDKKAFLTEISQSKTQTDLGSTIMKYLAKTPTNSEENEIFGQLVDHVFEGKITKDFGMAFMGEIKAEKALDVANSSLVSGSGPSSASSSYQITDDKVAGQRLTAASGKQIEAIDGMELIEKTLKKQIGPDGTVSIGGKARTLLSLDKDGVPGDRPRTGFRIDLQGDNSDGTKRLQIQTNGAGTTSLAEVNIDPSKSYSVEDLLAAFKKSLTEQTSVTLK